MIQSYLGFVNLSGQATANKLSTVVKLIIISVPILSHSHTASDDR